jgi:ABC-2 type transport system permease protein
MSTVIAIARKDLTLLFRVKAAWFFTFCWPLIVAIIFGSLFGGVGAGPSRMFIAITDEDQSPGSKQFVEALTKRPGFDVLLTSNAEATDLVRRGRRVGAIRIPKGFGDASGRLFFGAPPTVELKIDPSRQAETAMLQGFMLEQAAGRMQTVFSATPEGRRQITGMLEDVKKQSGAFAGQGDLQTMLGSLDAFLNKQAQAAPAAGAPASGPAPAGGGWRPLAIEVTSVERQRTGPANGFQITFPQGMQWGILGCMMSFAISLAVERTRGTLTRLLMSPAPAWTLLAGKGLACYLAILIVETALAVIGAAIFGVRPSSVGLLVLAILVVPIAFVGLMMFVASLGKTEEGASGAGWAMMMPMSMLGGGMIPLAMMPQWIQPFSYVSPVRWAIISYEGAIWRGFSLAEMVGPCAILLGIGAVFFALGARRFQSSLA